MEALSRFFFYTAYMQDDHASLISEEILKSKFRATSPCYVQQWVNCDNGKRNRGIVTQM